MSRLVIKKSDGGERHDVLDGKNSQLQKRREAQEITHREGRKVEISANLRAGKEHATFKVPA